MCPGCQFFVGPDAMAVRGSGDSSRSRVVGAISRGVALGIMGLIAFGSHLVSSNSGVILTW